MTVRYDFFMGKDVKLIAQYWYPAIQLVSFFDSGIETLHFPEKYLVAIWHVKLKL